MRANPGGEIDPKDVVGRADLIADLWRVLDRQSLVLTAERRMGKTCLVKKMVAQPRGDWLAFYSDLEGLRTPLEFVEKVFHDVEGYLGRFQRTALRVRKFLHSLGGTELAGAVRFPPQARGQWKTLLTKTLEDLAEHQKERIVLFWDELPLMLYNISRAADEGESVAAEMLDTLRSLRQEHKKLRMVYTGSIGLHNAVSDMKLRGYANDPTNDMYVADVPPLRPADAWHLARLLLDGEGISQDLVDDDAEELAQTIAREVDRIPYFIHHVIDQMSRAGTPPSPAGVRELVTACLTHHDDPWHMQHYRTRVDSYYAKDDRLFVLALLDAAASPLQPQAFADLFNAVKSTIETEDQETARRLLGLLQRDHYIQQEPDGQYRFRFPLVRRWWRLNRGLTT